MTVADALRDAAAQLAETSDTARLDAELLMAHALGVSRSDLLLRHMDALVPVTFADSLARRLGHEPVAYITGRQEFRGLELIVTPDVLIPRADSEATLEAALAAKSDARRVLDCGTGSGALLLALMAEIPDARGVGIDISPAVLDIAQANAKRLGLDDRAVFTHASWRAPGWSDDLGQFDLIIANPPYVETTADLAPDVRDYEPHNALFAGEDGLDDYRILVPQLRNLLTEEGAAVLEIGASQAQAVAEIAQDHGFATELRRDLAGRPRALILQ